MIKNIFIKLIFFSFLLNNYLYIYLMDNKEAENNFRMLMTKTQPNFFKQK